MLYMDSIANHAVDKKSSAVSEHASHKGEMNPATSESGAENGLAIAASTVLPVPMIIINHLKPLSRF